MKNTLKQSAYLLISSSLLGLSLHTAAAVFTCTLAGGEKIYTSEPSAACEKAETGRISSYKGGEYTLSKPPSEKQQRPKNNKKPSHKKEKTVKLDTKANKKAASEKGQGYQGFPVMTHSKQQQ